MKRAVVLLVTAFILSMNLHCDDGIVDLQNNNTKKFTIGFNNNYTEISDKTSSTLGFTAGYKFSKYFEIGINLSGIWYDYRLNELDPNKSYHVESGYSGMYLKGIINISDKIDVNMSVLSGMGLIQLKYDNKYRDELKWDEELIDREHFSIAELTMGVGYKINNLWKIGINSSYRATSDIYIETLNNDFLNNLNFGLAVEYSIY